MKKNNYLSLVKVCWCVVAIWALSVSGALAQNQVSPAKVFGLVGITHNQTARIHFTNIEEISRATRPIGVQLFFLDSDGEPLRDTEYGLILPPDPIFVQPGETTSVELRANDLWFPYGSMRVMIQPVIQILSSNFHSGIAMLEIVHYTLPTYMLASEFSLANFLSVGTTPPTPFRLGPVTLSSNYTARLNLTGVQVTPGVSAVPLDAHMFFNDYLGMPIGSDSTVHLSAGQSASIEISGSAYSRTLVALVDFLSGSPLEGRATLEIIDNATGMTVMLLEVPSQSGGGSGGAGAS